MMPAVLPAAGGRPRVNLPDRRAAVNASREQAVACARACDAFRGLQTVVLDVTKITPLFDFFVITTGKSSRQMRAIAEGADAALKELGSRRMGVEGFDSGSWIVQDYGDVVLHVFNSDARTLYDLERLWGDAPAVEWSTGAA